MSQEANEILTLLTATEGFVKTQISLYLPFPSVIQASLDADSRSQLILESVGYGEIVGDDGTDELLRRAAATDEQPKRRTPAPEIIPDDLFSDGAGDDEATEGPPTDEDDSDFPPAFEAGGNDRLQTSPIAKAMKAALIPGEDTSDPPTLGDPEETEDLLRDNEKSVADALGLGDLDEEDDHTDPGSPTEIDIDDTGQDALVTIEDTSDPRSDLDGLSDLDDSDLEVEDSNESEVVIRKSDALDVMDDQLETFDLMADDDDEASPDEEETFVADLADIERMKAKMVEPDAATPRPAGAVAGVRLKPPPPGPRVAGVTAVSAGGKGVTAGLYGNPAVPTIRDRNAPKPAAAAIQIDDAQQAASGAGAAGSLLEEEEVLELGSSEDYGEEYEEDENEGGGLSLGVQGYDEEEEEEELEELEELDDIDLEELEPDDVALEPLDDGPSEAELAALVKKAMAAVEDGDMEAGINLYSDVLDSAPENVDAYVARGRLYLDYGDYSRAMSDFMHAETLQPENPEPQVAVGDLHFARKDYNRAIDYFNEALKMSPNHAMAYCRRGISHYYRKHYGQALEDLNKAQKIDDDIPNIRTYIAMAKKKAKR